MPVTRCIIGKKVGFKWGKSGKCYTYDPRSHTSKNSAKKKAIMQGLAIGKGRLRTDTVIKPEKPFITWLKAIGLSIPAIRSRLRRRAPRPFIPRTVENKYVRQLKILVGEWRTLYLQIVDPSLVGLAQEAYALKPPESVGVKTDACGYSDEIFDLLKHGRIRIPISSFIFKLSKYKTIPLIYFSKDKRNI